MKQKAFLILTLLFWGISQVAGQSFTDNDFWNVVKITDRDVFTNDRDYLFTRAVPAAKKPVVYVDADVPPLLLTKIFPEFGELIILMPNYPFYKEIAASTPPGMCAEPLTSTLVFERRPGAGGAQLQKRVLEGEFPRMAFQPEKTVQTAGFLKVYLTETYATGSTASNGPETFAKLFKKETGIRIRGIYTATQGERTTYYYTLEDMTDADRLRFLKARQAISGLNPALLYYQQPSIFTPRLVPKPDGIRKQTFQ